MCRAESATIIQRNRYFALKCWQFNLLSIIIIKTLCFALCFPFDLALRRASVAFVWAPKSVLSFANKYLQFSCCNSYSWISQSFWLLFGAGRAVHRYINSLCFYFRLIITIWICNKWMIFHMITTLTVAAPATNRVSKLQNKRFDRVRVRVSERWRAQDENVPYNTKKEGEKIW